jgi:RNA recognition motif-containing protein
MRSKSKGSIEFAIPPSTWENEVNRRDNPNPETIMKNKLYVDNLPSALTENDLMDLFSSYGNIADAYVRVDRTGDRPRSFGCITMATPEGARLAMRELNGKEIGAFTLILSEARPIEQRTALPGESRSPHCSSRLH